MNIFAKIIIFKRLRLLTRTLDGFYSIHERKNCTKSRDTVTLNCGILSETFCYFCQILLKIYDIHVYKVPYTNSVNSRIESCSHTLQGLLFIYFSLLIEVVFYVIKNLPTLFFLSICNVGSQLFGGLNKFLQNMSKWYLILVRQMLKYISEYILWYYYLLTCRYYYYLEIQESRARSSDLKKIYSGFVKSCFPVTGRLFFRI